MKSCLMVSTLSLDLPWDRCGCDCRPLKPWKLQPLPTKTQLLSRLWVAVLQEVLHVLFKFVAIAAAGDVLDLSGLCFWAAKHLQIPGLSWNRFTASSYTIPCNMYSRQQSQLVTLFHVEPLCQSRYFTKFPQDFLQETPKDLRNSCFSSAPAVA